MKKLISILFIIFLAGFSFSQTNVWTGEKDNCWFNPDNWENGQIPDQASEVIISSYSKNKPIICANTYIKSLTIQSHSSLEINQNCELNISGNINLEGVFLLKEGIVNISGEFKAKSKSTFFLDKGQISATKFKYDTLSTVIFMGSNQTIPSNDYSNLEICSTGSTYIAANSNITCDNLLINSPILLDESVNLLIFGELVCNVSSKQIEMKENSTISAMSVLNTNYFSSDNSNAETNIFESESQNMLTSNTSSIIEL
ncbi:MAG: hypothetical protein JXL97_19505 [Bacteroidales bacterium]|nr:hypothetical protein [Bacteroidales bacterium]